MEQIENVSVGVTVTKPAADKSSFGEAQAATLFEENGLWGLKNEDGTLLYPPEYLFIGKSIDNVLFIKPDWHYMELWQCSSTVCGYLCEDERPYISNGKAGFKHNGEITIPAEYDYLTIKFGDEDGRIFYAVKNGRGMYLDENGKEVLTRVRRFDGEKSNYSPFWLTTDDFNYFTTMSYVGKPCEENPNVVKIDGAWVELDRYSKDEILQMLINPADDLALTEKNLRLLCNSFSYEYIIRFAHAKGEHPLHECLLQLNKMDTFSNSWYYIVKIWLAPGEQLPAKELRQFERDLRRVDKIFQDEYSTGGEVVLGDPLFAIGHSDDLQPGEVRMLMITHYHERCFPPLFEYEWVEKRERLPLCQLKDEIPWLRNEVDTTIQEPHREEVFQDQLLECISGLRYHKEQSWEEAREALDFFLALGSPLRHSLHSFLKQANHYAKLKKPNAQAVRFFLNAALWAIEKGDTVNEVRNGKSSLDLADALITTSVWQRKFCTNVYEWKLPELIDKTISTLMEKGAKWNFQLKKERNSNTDYFKELEYLRADDTSEKVMPGLSIIR